MDTTQETSAVAIRNQNPVGGLAFAARINNETAIEILPEGESTLQLKEGDVLIVQAIAKAKPIDPEQAAAHESLLEKVEHAAETVVEKVEEAVGLTDGSEAPATDETAPAVDETAPVEIPTENSEASDDLAKAQAEAAAAAQAPATEDSTETPAA